MITREDLERAERCTAGTDCPVHTLNFPHHPLTGIDVETDLRELVDIVEALEPVMHENWDDDVSFGSIAVDWITHMGTTHGARCMGPHCAATADTPAYVVALRRMWRNIRKYDPDAIARAGYRDAIRDLAHELGVDLDG